MLVGGGPAADGAAFGLREAGFTGAITLLSEEPLPPYQRPPLSKAFLTGTVGPSQLPLRPREQYDAAGIELRLGERAEQLDFDRRLVRLAAGTLAYDLLLIATGVEARRVPELAGALHLRRLPDAEELRDALAGPRLTIVGAGFIGCEVAASARARGVEVTLVEAQDAPLVRVLGPRLGSWLAEVHREHGVDLRLGATELPPGRPLLAAVGTEIPEPGPQQVDELGRTEIDGVFAAGDCAAFLSPLFGRHVRVEHFQTAWRHGAAVGRSMAGAGYSFAEAPWFWSDQYDLNLQYAGAGLPWDEEVVRGAFGEPPFTVFQLAGGVPVGAVGVNDGRTISRTRRLLEAGAAVTRAELEDPGFDLRRALS